MSQYQNKEQDRRIEKIEEHIFIINEELGFIKSDVCWLKKAVKRIDDRTWLILGTIIIGFLIQIILKL